MRCAHGARGLGLSAGDTVDQRVDDHVAPGVAAATGHLPSRLLAALSTASSKGRIGGGAAGAGWRGAARVAPRARPRAPTPWSRPAPARGAGGGLASGHRATGQQDDKGGKRQRPGPGGRKSGQADVAHRDSSNACCGSRGVCPRRVRPHTPFIECSASGRTRSARRSAARRAACDTAGRHSGDSIPCGALRAGPGPACALLRRRRGAAGGCEGEAAQGEGEGEGAGLTAAAGAGAGVRAGAGPASGAGRVVPPAAAVGRDTGAARRSAPRVRRRLAEPGLRRWRAAVSRPAPGVPAVVHRR